MATDFLSALNQRAPSPRNNPQLQTQQLPSSISRPRPIQFSPLFQQRSSLFNTNQRRSPSGIDALFHVAPSFLQANNQSTWANIGNTLFPQYMPGYQAPSDVNRDNSSYGGDPNGARGLDGTKQWDSLMKQAGTEAGVPWQILASIMGIETGGSNTNDPGGAMGLMQIMPGDWQNLANQYGGDLSNPYTNIRTAADILKMNYDKYGSWDKAAAAYFGAIDSQGNITGASDSYGTTGFSYVNLFRNNLASLGYGQPSNAELQSGGQGASPWANGAIQAAMSMQGTPYVWGGDSPGGFDCSGLVEWAYAQQGKSFGRTAQQQYDNTQHISSSQLQAGDLIFFMFPDDAVRPGEGGKVNHVAIYLGNGQMLQASSNGDIVKIMPVNDSWYSDHVYGYGRVV
jgi:cell wall-associated NlpC family hydrolase